MHEYIREGMKSKKNKDIINIYKNRLPLISWFILPILAVWLSTNYLLGLNRPVVWHDQSNQKTKIVYMYEENPAKHSFEWKKTGLITLWFDDAWYSQYSEGLPILETYKLTGALAVPTNFIDDEDYMTWTQVVRTQYKGWEITSHTKSHNCEPNKLDLKTVSEELVGSLKELREHNLNVSHFVTPCGVGNQNILKVTKDNYLSLRTTEEGLNELPVQNPYDLKIKVITRSTTLEDIKNWIEDARPQNAWLIISFHQIGNDNEEYEITPDLFQKAIETIASSGLPVVLPSQALQITLSN